MEPVIAQLEKFWANCPKDIPQLAHHVAYTEIFPYYMLVHCLLVAMSLRARPGARAFAHSHPLSSLLVCVTSSFGGSLIVNFLLGRAIIDVYTNKQTLTMAALVWYFVFFCPFDILHSLLQLKLVKIVLIILKEVQRMRVIGLGVAVATKLYPGNWFIAILLGSIRGSGAKLLMRPLDHYSRGIVIADHELLKPSFSTKVSVIASGLLLAHKAGMLGGGLRESQLQLFIVVFVASQHIAQLILSSPDPFTFFERIICEIGLRADDDEPIVEASKKSEKNKKNN